MKKKKILKKIIFIVILILCFTGLFFSITDIIKWKINSNKTLKQIEKINEIVNIQEIVSNEEYIEEDNIEISGEDDETIDVNPYYDYLKLNLIYVDFSELKNINSDVVGWIQVNGTNVNYPFVHTNDNKFYLNHSFDKSYNPAGWVYLDYRNNENLDSKNNIIYAHNMKDNTMFGSLKNTLSNNWLKDTNNHVIRLSTNNENTLWQIFSVYNIETTSDYLKINFQNDDEFLKFGNKLKDRSIYNFNTTIDSDDKILTLSTCYKKTHKTVIHAKLIKKENR